jgi:uncharacterized protein with FMN-binding domain
MAKKIWGVVIAVVVVLIVAFYFIFSGSGTGSNSGAPAAVTTPTSTDAPTTTTDSATGTTGSSNPMGGITMGQYKDGTYTGPVSDAIYGQLQVVVTISGGMITNVDLPVYPDSPGHTSQVSASALPQLKQEAIAAQSANVAVVSGATQDSQAFQQSLAAALAQAKS